MQFIYQCPVCSEKLERINQSYTCPNGHSYDISREGYVNLLLANQKNSKSPGDDKSMALSRQRFLDNRYYDPLSMEIVSTVTDLFAKAATDKPFNILDIGCGTGFYSGKLAERLLKKKEEERVHLRGIDISKPAVQKAAKQYPNVQFCIGTSFHLPYLDQSFDVIFSIFSPFDSKELFRVLKPGGKFLLVRPATKHLKEVGELIYSEFKLQGTPPDLTIEPEISIVNKHRLTYQIHINNNDDIMNLVKMTPYHWHLTTEKESKLAERKELTVTIDMQITLFAKQHNLPLP